MEGVCPARCGRRQFITNTVIKGGSTCHARNPCSPELWSLWSSGLRSPPLAATPRPAHPPARVRGRPRSSRNRACSSSPPATLADHAAPAIRAILATPVIPVPVLAIPAKPGTPATHAPALAGRAAHAIPATPARLRVVPVARATPAIHAQQPADRVAHAIPATPAPLVLRSARTAKFHASPLRAVRAIHAPQPATPVHRATPATPVRQRTHATRAGLAIPAARARPLAGRAAPVTRAILALPAKRSS